MGEAERILADQAFSMAAQDKLFWMPRKSYGPDQVGSLSQVFGGFRLTNDDDTQCRPPCDKVQ